MSIKNSIMQEHLSSRNKHEMIGGSSYYETGISKFARMRKDNKQRTIVQDIADGIELSERKKEIRNFLKS
ncbi:MAG: Uncharacterised protein [Cryomorphaceae bacterium]|nr:MAG: Uncharacterised protein [Cryomorphaceae bacterium]